MSRASLPDAAALARIVHLAQAESRSADRAIAAVLGRWPVERKPFRPAPNPARARRHQTGLSLVGLLVGSALGLAAVAAAGSLLAAGIRESRDAGLETRLVQDLRTAAEIVSRDLRRAGHWAGAASGVRRDDGTSPLVNPYGAFSPDTGASAVARFSYSRDAVEDHAVGSNERFGFRLRNGALELQLGDGNWQAMTDIQTLTVTTFTVTPRTDLLPLDDHCPAACPAASTTCPPRLAVRSADVEIAGRAAGDGRVVREVRSRARLRADAIVGSCT